MNHPSARPNCVLWQSSPAGLVSRARRSAARMRGFTVLETLIVVTLVSILLAFAVPTFRDLLASKRVSANVSAFASSLRLARTEAIKRGIEVTVCRGSVSSGSPVCTASTDWSPGWLVFADRGTLGTFDGTDVLIRAEDQPGGVSNAVTSSLSTQITFLRAGIAPGAQRSVLFRPQVPTSSSAYSRLSKRLCVNSTGGTRLIDGDGAC